VMDPVWVPEPPDNPNTDPIFRDDQSAHFSDTSEHPEIKDLEKAASQDDQPDETNKSLQPDETNKSAQFYEPNEASPLLSKPPVKDKHASDWEPTEEARLATADAAGTHWKAFFPQRVRLSSCDQALLYLAVLVETVCLLLTSGLSFVLSDNAYAWYHAASALPTRVPLWGFVAYRLSSKSGIDSRLCCNSYLWALDTLTLCAVICFVTYAGRELAILIELPYDGFLPSVRPDSPHFPIVLSVIGNFFVIISTNFLFRTVVLTYAFSNIEYKAYKWLQLLDCLLILCFGLQHCLTVAPGKGASTLYIFTLLMWRREMFGTLSRMDQTNKFVGIGYNYRLAGSDGWFLSTESQEPMKESPMKESPMKIPTGTPTQVTPPVFGTTYEAICPTVFDGDMTAI